jgi:ferredoxin
MTLLPTVDPMACSAHGDCAVLAPEIFRVDDTAVVVGTGPPDLVMAAAEACPAVAISVVDEATGRQLYPRCPRFRSSPRPTRGRPRSPRARARGIVQA